MVDLTPPNAATGVTEGRHETSDVSVRGLSIATLGLGVLVAVALLGGFWLIRLYQATQVVESVPSPLGPPEGPRAGDSPRVIPQQSRIYREMTREKQRILTSYGELDEDSDDSAIRIPIEQAKQILSRRGLSGSSAGTTPPAGSNDPMPEEDQP
jgi:hypothetical protein